MMVIMNVISYALVLLGALNWGLYGFFDFNLLAAIFGGARSVGAIIVYSLIVIAALWLILAPIIERGSLKFRNSMVEA